MINQLNLSATSIQCFKTCPMRYYYRYILGLTPIEDTDALRIGTNYHRIQEIYDAEPGGVCECVSMAQEIGSVYAINSCTLCEGTGLNPQDPMDAVIRHLNERYSTPPLSKTAEEWETERIILLYTLVGYRWWYEQQDAGYEVESLEQKFDISLLSPTTGAKLKAQLRGKIDRVFSAGPVNRFVHDYKSTSKNIDPDSTFWAHLTLDTQTRLYTYAAKQLGLGMCGVLYDAWHKPGIRPKKLSQADSKKFVEGVVDQETGDRYHEYCGEKFEMVIGDNFTCGSLRSYGDFTGVSHIFVNGKDAELKRGAKEGTFAIRETPEMFGARLLQDITTRPEFYFARKEIVHHSTDIEAFQRELVNIYYDIRFKMRNNSWWCDESACEATYKCEFIDFCYNHLDIGPDDIPDNFTKKGR